MALWGRLSEHWWGTGREVSEQIGNQSLLSTATPLARPAREGNADEAMRRTLPRESELDLSRGRCAEGSYSREGPCVTCSLLRHCE